MWDLKDVLAAAEGGDIEAQIKLGDYYCQFGFERDGFAQGKERYLVAAQQGNITGQIKLGDLCFRYLEQFAEAEQWYRTAANQGDAEAQVRLGDYYRIHEHNLTKAAEWYERAAYQNDGEAQVRIGDYITTKSETTAPRKFWQFWRETLSHNESVSEAHVDLLTDQIIMSLSKDRQILFRAGLHDPIIANWKNGQTLDFRGFTEDTRPFGPEQSKALVEDYAQQRTQATEISAADERKEAMQQWLQSAPNYQNQTQERRIEAEREQGFDR